MLRHTNLPVNIVPIFCTSPPSHHLLQKSQQIPCGDRCICNGRFLCNVKNVVYKITCLTCQGLYVGETHRTIRTRIKEHLTMSQSLVLRHFRSSHNARPSIESVEFQVVQRNFADTLQRKEAEKLHINILKPNINVQFPS